MRDSTDAETGRTGHVSDFALIARDSFARFKSLSAAMPQPVYLTDPVHTPEEGERWSNYWRLHGEWRRGGLIGITFAAATVEAYMFDYAASHLSATYAEKYLDKLDPVAKWVVVPRLVTGREIDREGQAFQLLRQLIKSRNGIIHSKSLDIRFASETHDDRAKRVAAFSAEVHSAHAALPALRDELLRVHPDAKGVWAITCYTDRLDQA